jgi:hypothetical protein
VRGSRAAADIVVRGKAKASGAAVAAAAQRGAVLMSAQAFCVIASATAAAREAVAAAGAALSAAEGRHLHRTMPAAAAAAGSDTTSNSPPAAKPTRRRGRRQPVPETPPICPGVFVCGNRGAWHRPLTFVQAVDVDSRVKEEATRLSTWLRERSGGSDTLAIQCAYYMVRVLGDHGVGCVRVGFRVTGARARPLPR